MSLKSMRKIWDDICKAHGEEGISAASEGIKALDEEDVISTGSLVLDEALGTWGIPRGHIVQYAGFQSSGKTLLSLTTIAEWQKRHPENWAVFVDAEYTYDPTWAASLGVDNERVLLIKENSASKIFDYLVGVPAKRKDNSAELKKAKPGILDRVIEEKDDKLGLIVLDSVAAIQPPQEETSRSGKDNIALHARFLPPVLRKITPMLDKAKVAFIAINQLRYKPDVMYGDPTDSPGGTALKFSCAQMINLGVINSADSKFFDEEDKEIQIGHHVRAKIQKNKKAPPFRKAEFAIEYTKGVVNRHVEIRDLGDMYKVLERPNNKTWIYNEEKFNGKDAMAEFIKNNPEAQKDILTKIKEAKAYNLVKIEPKSEDIENEEKNEE